MGVFRHGPAMGLAAGLVGLVTGCASSSPSCHQPPSPGPASARPAAGTSAGPAPAACRTGSLEVRVDATQAGAATGSTYYPIDFTNTSASACDLNGFPGVTVVTARGATGRQLGAAAQQDPDFDPVAVRIVPGGHAHAWLQVGAAGSYPAAACEPTAASWVRVSAPGSPAAG